MKCRTTKIHEILQNYTQNTKNRVKMTVIVPPGDPLFTAIIVIVVILFDA